MRYIELSKAAMFSYKANCKELYAMQQENRPVVPVINGYVKGRISRPVEAEVMRLLKAKHWARSGWDGVPPEEVEEYKATYAAFTKVISYIQAWDERMNK